jgi:hypothetical protein
MGGGISGSDLADFSIRVKSIVSDGQQLQEQVEGLWYVCRVEYYILNGLYER